MDQRLKNIKAQHEQPAQVVTTPSQSNGQKAAVSPDAQTPTVQKEPEVAAVVIPTGQPKVDRLSARQQEQLAALKREQRFADALALANTLLKPSEVLYSNEGDIRDTYIRTKTLAEANVANVDTVQEIEALLVPAINNWKMNEDDPAWAQALITKHVKRLGLDGRPTPTKQAVGTTAVAQNDEAAPAQAGSPQSTPASGDYILPDKSPLGFTQVELEADRKINHILLNNPSQQGEITRALAKIPEGSPNFGTVTLRSKLWNLGPEVLQQAIDEKRGRLRVTNPISGGLWDIVSANREGLLIRNPTGSSMTVNRGGIQHDELSKLYKQFNRISGLTGQQYASAAAIELSIGETTSAKLFARQARGAGYDKADELDNLIKLQRDRGIMQLIADGIAAGKQLDPFKLEETVTKLTELELTDSPVVTDAIAQFTKRREAILNGTGGGSTEMDNLTFDSPNDRLAFARRSGWMVINGSYSNTEASGELRRDDLGNAQSIALDLSLKEKSGQFRLDFRGVELIADTAQKKMIIRAAGSNRQKEIPFTFATNTVYTVQMSYNQQKSMMEVGINRLPPETISLPKATPSLVITPSEDASISLHEIAIRRFGQEPEETISNEEILASQIALRSLGLIPYGATVKDKDSTAIIIPEGKHQSGLGIPLRDGDKGIRFKVNGTGQLMIRVGDQARGTEGDYVTVDVPQLNDGKATVSVTIDGDLWVLNVTYGDDNNPIFLEKKIKGKANNVVVLAEKSLTIESTPEAIR